MNALASEGEVGSTACALLACRGDRLRTAGRYVRGLRVDEHRVAPLPRLVARIPDEVPPSAAIGSVVRRFRRPPRPTPRCHQANRSAPMVAAGVA